MGLEIQSGSFGVTGVKRSFSPKMLFLLHIAWYGHGTHAYSSARYLLQKLWVYKFSRDHLGSHGSKGHVHQKRYFPFKLHGMDMELMHIHQLDTRYKFYGSRNSVGIIWGHRGQKVIFTKMLFLFHITWYGHGTHASSSARYPLQKLWV